MPDDPSSKGTPASAANPDFGAISRGLLQMYAAPDTSGLAHALQSLIAPAIGAAVARVFLDDGSGTLTPVASDSENEPDMLALKLDASQGGAVASVLQRGETIVLDNPADILGDRAPALPVRRLMLCRLAWEGEVMGMVVFGDAGEKTDLELYTEMAAHASLALVRLRALNRAYRYGGIDPVRWIFDQEWFEARLDEETARSRRYGRPLSLLLFTFRGLDEFAERGGPQQANIFLRRVAAVVRGEIRTPDVLAAFGQAGIAVLLPETTKEAAAPTQGRIAARILRLSIAGPDLASARLTLLTAVAAYPDDGDTAAALIASARAALAPIADERDLEKTA